MSVSELMRWRDLHAKVWEIWLQSSTSHVDSVENGSLEDDEARMLHVGIERR